MPSVRRTYDFGDALKGKQVRCSCGEVGVMPGGCGCGSKSRLKVWTPAIGGSTSQPTTT